VRADLALADRAEAVRGAARAWRRAGAIDAAALAAVEERYPDDRVRVGTAFRVLLFLFTVGAAAGGWGFVALLLGSSQLDLAAALAAAGGVALGALTEVQIGSQRRRQGGTEAATSFAAIGFLLGAAAWYLSRTADLPPHAELPILCLLGALLAGAAAWRWGYPAYAGAAAAALLVALARLPAGRLLWIVLPLAAAPALLRLGDSPRLPPAHRASLAAVLFVALAALYVAVHLGSLDAQLVEELGGRAGAPPPPGDWRRWMAVVATAAVPLALLAWGLRRRRLVPLAAGAGAAVASLVTLTRYVDLGPAWLLLTMGGALAIALALGLARYLDSGPDRTDGLGVPGGHGGCRGGFTAAPLFTDRRRQAVLEAGVAALAAPMPVRSAGAAGEPEPTGGGGRAGGAGASGDF
jgi:MFS family permease